MGKVIVVLADGFEEIEAVSVIDILRRADVEVCAAGVKDGNVKGAHGLIVKPDSTLEDIDEDDYDMIVLPGGAVGAENIGKSKDADDILRKFKKDDKYIAAICAAPKILADKGLLNGCMATSYPSFKDAVAKDSDYQEAIVVVDENIITSRGPATAAEFAFTLVELLVEEDTAEKLREGMLFTDDDCE
ncbi:DJ-1 family protein [Denitrovibrio acetiphilus DSM 12809]|uniref:DJ-1 family protein n=1 Tax=Denitrovibrio acetiphilus (strain DSM 12809 / NBRC 114555 / N2460) TaxID=522772 RepID=D4H2Q0_DENA2|nr:DJ-1 family glyoxalase III [Denitrovibrio acetiphilus]ADD67111.1 DJ-1 family protein [Denitrovibrio acetiphilus DSM 12809]